MDSAALSTTPITVLIADDEHLARDRLRVLLSGEPDVQLVGECSNGLEALAAITALRPELAFLDVQMPDLDGLGVIAALDNDEVPEIRLPFMITRSDDSRPFAGPDAGSTRDGGPVGLSRAASGMDRGGQASQAEIGAAPS